MKNLIVYVIILLPLFAIGQEDPKLYQFYDANGKKCDWKSLVNLCKYADVVFFGEIHNQVVCHFLELKLAQALAKDRSIGYEMIETDRQASLDSLVLGRLETEKFDQQKRNWPNYETDYKPIVSWAIGAKVEQFASNCPRKYASMVFKQGSGSLLGLNDSAKRFLGPMPYRTDTTLPGYNAMLSMMGNHGSKAYQMVEAQVLKDITMADRILQQLKKGKKVFHINGSYHSDNKEGILAQINTLCKSRNQKAPSMVTISTVVPEESSVINAKRYKPQDEKLADFYLLVPPDAPTSY